MKLGVTLDILNQKATPAFYADTLANRPAAGYVGRVFISTDTLDLYRDTGTTWVLLSPSSTGTITGSGAAGQVTYFSAASSITGSNNLFWDSTNNHLGIQTATPDCALDVNHNGTFVAKFNNTTSANTLIGFYNLDNPQWLIGSNSVANNLTFYDATNFPTLTATTTMATDGTTYIGGQTTGSGKLNVYSATSDNGIQISGANAPSLRIDNAPTGATLRAGLGISTATNNFIQGSANRDFCIFNGTTTLASPILFGIYGTTNVQEAARISAARNLIIGGVTDSGEKLQVIGTTFLSSNVAIGSSGTSDISWGTAGGIKLSRTNVGPEYALNQRWTGSLAFVDIASSTQWNGGVTILGNGGGNVGIGTLSPTDPQSFGRALEISSSSFGAALYLKSSASSTYAWMGYDYTALQMIIAATGTNTGIRFETGSAERMRISNTGNLVIGTTTDNGNRVNVNGNIWGNALTRSDRFVSNSSFTANIVFNTFTTFYTMTSTYGGIYLVILCLDGQNTADWAASAIIYTNGSSSTILTQQNGTLVQITTSGLDIQGKQTGTSPNLDMAYRVLKINNV